MDRVASPAGAVEALRQILDYTTKTANPSRHVLAGALKNLADRVASSEWEGKLVGTDFRLQWNRSAWKLEELPQKGKKKLRIASCQNPSGVYGSRGGLDAYLYQNILRTSHVSASDSFDHVKDKLTKAMEEATKITIAGMAKSGDTTKWDFLEHMIQWTERQVYFTEVMPEGMEPFNVEGKDFVVKVEWTSFSAYSPNSDFQQADPHYTLYEASAPASARKMYQTLKEAPNALKSIPWDKFDGWLKEKKIGYKTHFSQWG